MADAENEPKKLKSVGVKTYARARIFFKDRESLERAIEVKTAEETSNGKGLLTVLAGEEDTFKSLNTEFTDCFPGVANNEYCFDKVCRPLIGNCLAGYKALLIAYGQTGSGKTFTLIGAKGAGQLGLLPRTLKEFVEHDSVLNIQLKGFEAYSTTLQKIPIYDLFDPQNKFTFAPFEAPSNDAKKNKAAEYLWVQKKSMAAKALWASKVGGTGTDTMNEGYTRNVENLDDAFKLVEEAHDSSHFAKTGKNPESSRGHTVYIIVLQIKNPKGEDYSPVQTEFVCVDLAGSEGGSTLLKLPDGPDKTARFLEGGVINYGLSSLKDMFAEMRRKGKLKKTQGVGLRKLLYPFVTTNTMMSIVFTLSPSHDNIMATRATMKFARDACKLKMKPVADTGKKNWERMYNKLKLLLEEKEDIIKKYEEGMKKAEAIMREVEENDTATEKLIQNLQTLYFENTDRVDWLMRKHKIVECFENEFMDSIEAKLEDTKLKYTAQITELLEEAELEERPDPEKLIDEQIELGNDLSLWMKRFEKDFRANVIDHKKNADDGGEEMFMNGMLSVNSRKLRSAATSPGLMGGLGMAGPHTMSSVARTAHRRQATSDFLSDTIRIRNTVKSSDQKQSIYIRTLDNLFSDTEDDFSSKMELLGISEDEEENESEEEPYADIEQVDLTKPPKWYEDKEEEAQEEMQDKVERNLVQGAISEEIRKELRERFDLTDEQIDELIMFFMVKQGEDHDQDVIYEFHEEMGITADDEPYRDVDKIVDMQRQLVEIENDMMLDSVTSQIILNQSSEEEMGSDEMKEEDIDDTLDVSEEDLPPSMGSIGSGGGRLPSSRVTLDVFIDNAKNADKGEDAIKLRCVKRKFKDDHKVNRMATQFEKTMKLQRDKQESSSKPQQRKAYDSSSQLDDLSKHEKLLGEGKMATLNASDLSKCTFRELRMYAKDMGLKSKLGLTKAQLIRMVIDDNTERLKKKVADLENAVSDPDVDIVVIDINAATRHLQQKFKHDSVILKHALDSATLELLLKEAWSLREVLNFPPTE